MAVHCLSKWRLKARQCRDMREDMNRVLCIVTGLLGTLPAEIEKINIYYINIYSCVYFHCHRKINRIYDFV